MVRLSDWTMNCNVLHALSVAYPIVFLSVAAFMVNALLARLIRLQREQIAQLKAQGYSRPGRWGWHYMKFALVIVVIGTADRRHRGAVSWAEDWCNLYTIFFRFPSLEFRMDYSALGTALAVSAGACIVGVASVVWQAVKLPPAEAMRPEPPADFSSLRSWSGMALHSTILAYFRMALSNIERKPWSGRLHRLPVSPLRLD